ncbi:hypothetical protein P692DRAFT_20668200, partial [Suillus brevipes Sb2]
SIPAMSNDACALNADGSLKDAKDIVFYHDPDDPNPIVPTSSAQLSSSNPQAHP